MILTLFIVTINIANFIYQDDVNFVTFFMFSVGILLCKSIDELIEVMRKDRGEKNE